ncbi:20256_t:CDS:2, partial [Cetraspora pellucida]
ESNFRSHLKWRIEKDKDKSFVIVVYNKIEIKESFKELLFERCRVQQSIERSPIHFYSKCDPYYEFTNFFPISVIIDDVEWPTTENYFQAQKFEHKWIYNEIREACSAREAFKISRYYDPHKRHDWEDRIPDTGKIFKENVMRTALMAKFGQHERLKYMLLSTGNIPLFEHTKNDLYWGDGGDFGGGQNKLGMILQEVREIYMLEEVQKIATIKSTLVHSAPRKRRWLNHLSSHVLNEDIRLTLPPSPVKTIWFSWFRFIIWMKPYLKYLITFYQKERKLPDPSKDIINLASWFSNPNTVIHIELITMFITYNGK